MTNPWPDGLRPALHVLLQNFLEKARKFTPLRPHAAVEIGARTGNGERIFLVKDNEVGFDMAHVGQLLGAFQRPHSAQEFPDPEIEPATETRVIHRHGGPFRAESSPRQGATFCFPRPGRFVPISKPEPARPRLTPRRSRQTENPISGSGFRRGPAASNRLNPGFHYFHV
jgi:light-regulated signal transduction histidine kinase (bacteriophytochrome)